MPMTFGEQLNQFALSTDIVDRDRFQRVMDMIDRYTKNALKIHTTKLMLECETNGQPGLMRRDLGDFDIETVAELRDDEGRFVGHAAFAFAMRRPMWIIEGEGKGALDGSASYRDLWSGLENIPPYRAVGSVPVDAEPTRTSVIIPLTQYDRVVGVLNFETSEYVEITQAATAELMRLASCISRMLRLYQDHLSNEESSSDAIDRLQSFLAGPLPKLTKPKVFLASSARADQAVIDSIIRILEKHADRIDHIHWEKMREPGNIIAQLLEAIEECRYGICYFSEKDGDEYRDNLNVVFEAGMFHGRTGEAESTSRTWIPIRERQGPDLPFDLAQERILWVDRTPEGAVDTERFEKALDERVVAMVTEEDEE